MSKFLHKCKVSWCTTYKVWIVRDRKCGIFTENKSWRRAVYLGIYHFKIELEAGASRAIKAHTLRKCQCLGLVHRNTCPEWELPL